MRWAALPDFGRLLKKWDWCHYLIEMIPATTAWLSQI